MAVVTIIAARDVIGILACRDVAIMTGTAAAEHLRMIYRKWRHPDSRVVAILADIGCQWMGWILARRCDAIVTIDAAANDVGVVKSRG